MENERIRRLAGSQVVGRMAWRRRGGDLKTGSS